MKITDLKFYVMRRVRGTDSEWSVSQSASITIEQALTDAKKIMANSAYEAAIKVESSK